MNDIVVTIADSAHTPYAEAICQQIATSAQARGTGIASRSITYIEDKMRVGNAVIALTVNSNPQVAGFCYIETWEHHQFVANSGLIVFPEFRGQGLASRIKRRAFNLSRSLFPQAKLFGLTTNLQVMRINSELGYLPVTFSELTRDEIFWRGCSSCVNYNFLQSKNYSGCLCTGMLYDPEYIKARQNKPEPPKDGK